MMTADGNLVTQEYQWCLSITDLSAIIPISPGTRAGTVRAEIAAPRCPYRPGPRSFGVPVRVIPKEYHLDVAALAAADAGRLHEVITLARYLATRLSQAG
jgi:hypothetical protein